MPTLNNNPKNYIIRYWLWLLMSLLFFVMGVFISFFIGRLNVEREQTTKRLGVLSELSTIQADLQGVVAATFNLTQGMVHFVSHQGDISFDLFNTMSKKAIEESPHIRNIALAPNNQVRWVYPLSGNEKAIGLKYLENDQQRETVIKAMKYGKPLLAGPVKLVQGGTGFINRAPIFIEKPDGSKKYWGLASIVTRSNSILDDGGITSSKTLKIALRGKDGKGESGSMIYGDTAVFCDNPVILDIAIPGGKWQVAAVPINGWSSLPFYRSKLFLIGLLNTFLITFFFIILINRNLSIKKRNVLLDEEIIHRKNIEQDLIKSKEQAESANRMKTAFLANMSHEIRTPMNSILGFSDLLLDKGLDKDNVNEILTIINNSTKQLLNVINDIIDISIIESGQMKISSKQTKLNASLHNIYQLHYLSAKEKGIEIIVVKGLSDSDANILIDEHRLIQVLNNLVNNAIKFTEKGVVEFGYECHDEILEFYVKDTGIGIPSDYHEVIFERFRQVDDQGKQIYGGNGLGLAISKSLVELMGGKIWLESEPKAGSQFYFTIPYRPIIDNSSEVLNRINSKEIDLVGKTILVAEDDSSSLLLLENLLRPYRANLIRVKNGADALEVILTHSNVDLVFLDIKMPIMDGIQTAKEIRKINSKIPIIAQTAYAMVEDRENAINAGCNYYISKPIEQKFLFDIIKKIFKS